MFGFLRAICIAALIFVSAPVFAQTNIGFQVTFPGGGLTRSQIDWSTPLNDRVYAAAQAQFGQNLVDRGGTTVTVRFADGTAARFEIDSYGRLIAITDVRPQSEFESFFDSILGWVGGWFNESSVGVDGDDVNGDGDQADTIPFDSGETEASCGSGDPEYDETFC